MTKHELTRPLVSTIVVLSLWGLSWALSYVDMGAGSLVVALLIAVAMAAVISVVFLEISQMQTSARLTAATAIIMLGILLGFVVLDVVARGIG